MVEAAAQNGWIDRERAIDETVLSIRRAGADIVLTYWAAEIAAPLTLSASGQLVRRSTQAWTRALRVLSGVSELRCEAPDPGRRSR